MPIYRIERYEIHTQAYLVEADTEAQAIVKALVGLAEPAPDEFSEFAEFCETKGLPIMDNLPLAQQVYELLQATDLPESRRAIGAVQQLGIIASIKSVEE